MPKRLASTPSTSRVSFIKVNINRCVNAPTIFDAHEPRRRRGEWCEKIIQEAWDVVIASAITHHVAKSFYQKIKLKLLRYPRHLQQVPRSSFHST